MSEQPTQLTEKDRERAFALALQRWDTIRQIGNRGVVVIGVVLVTYVGVALPVKYSAGKQTSISYVLNWMQNMRIDAALAYCGAAGSAGWAVWERKKRLRERKERDDRIRELELGHDPNRTSSGLLVDGREP